MKNNDGGNAFPKAIRDERDVINCGMSLAAYFAAHAPAEIPEWFNIEFPPRPNGDRDVQARYDAERAAALYFTWRWHFAEMMVAQNERIYGKQNAAAN